MTYDVIIIGAGPGGIFSAYELSKLCPDKKIGVFEEGQPLEKRDALRRLRQEVNRPREIDLREILLPLDDQRRRRHLSREPHDFRMAPFAEDHDLPSDGVHLFVCLHHTVLQTGDHRAGGVDDPDVHFPGGGVGRRRFSVGADEEAAARQVRHVGVGYGAQPQPFEALHFDAVVDDVAQRIDRTPLGEGFLSLRNSPDYAEAEARFVIDLYSQPFHCALRTAIRAPIW